MTDTSYKAQCHCGGVELSLFLPDGLVDPRRCDCSMCRRRGAIVASIPLADLKVMKGAELLSLYQFNIYPNYLKMQDSVGI
jgi:hypothetical protein